MPRSPRDGDDGRRGRCVDETVPASPNARSDCRHQRASRPPRIMTLNTGPLPPCGQRRTGREDAAIGVTDGPSRCARFWPLPLLHQDWNKGADIGITEAAYPANGPGVSVATRGDFSRPPAGTPAGHNRELSRCRGHHSAHGNRPFVAVRGWSTFEAMIVTQPVSPADFRSVIIEIEIEKR
jgi:hypothetical protein